MSDGGLTDTEGNCADALDSVRHLWWNIPCRCRWHWLSQSFDANRFSTSPPCTASWDRMV